MCSRREDSCREQIKWHRMTQIWVMECTTKIFRPFPTRTKLKCNRPWRSQTRRKAWPGIRSLSMVRSRLPWLNFPRLVSSTLTWRTDRASTICATLMNPLILTFPCSFVRNMQDSTLRRTIIILSDQTKELFTIGSTFLHQEKILTVRSKLLILMKTTLLRLRKMRTQWIRGSTILTAHLDSPPLALTPKSWKLTVTTRNWGHTTPKSLKKTTLWSLSLDSNLVT